MSILAAKTIARIADFQAQLALEPRHEHVAEMSLDAFACEMIRELEHFYGFHGLPERR